MERKEQDKILEIIRIVRNASSDEEAKRLLLQNIENLLDSDEIYQTLMQNKLYPSLMPIFNENKVVIKKWSKERLDLLNEDLLWMQREKSKETLLSNYDYINWIIDFVKTVKEFDTTGFVKNGKSFQEKDIENMNKLDLFADTIVEYADENNIIENKLDDGFSYYVKFLNEVFEIGFLHGNGVVCYVKLIDQIINSNSSIIDYEKVINQKKEKVRVNKQK